MARATDGRRSPESFLDAARSETPGKSHRGRLKIFLGASPGVGKTFAMLEEAHIRQRAGIDVVVGLVETHGRGDTASLLSGLEQLPRQMIDYRDQQLPEMDLDALIARKPQLALIDEFAHTNAPGSRHPKRWQDVMEVLGAGIDVTTTLNIQHIESLNDAVARITGVRVQETVPDDMLQKADEIELIDLPPDELINRLKNGKIYQAQQAGHALENFFTKGKLTALREMALRATAGRVDADMLNFMRSNAVQGPWPTDERLLVCINEAPVAKTLVRTGKRMADRAKIPWLVVTVVTPKHEVMTPESRHITRDALKLAETLGAETATLHTESDASAELLRFARQRNVTRLVVGRPRWGGGLLQRLVALWREPVSDRILDQATDFEITVVTAHVRTERKRANARRHIIKPKWSGYVAAAAAITAATLLAWPISLLGIVPDSAITVVYLLAVTIVGARFGLVPSLIATATGFLAYNFFYTEPYYTLSVTRLSDLVSLSFFLIGAVFTGTLASRLKAQVEGMRASQARTQTLYEFARKIAAATKSDDVLWAAATHIAKSLDCHAIIMTPDHLGQLEQVQGHPTIEENLDARAIGAARWAYDKGEAAGAGTNTLPNGDWLFVPLATAGQPFGVIGVKFRDVGQLQDPEARRLLLAVEDQVAVAVERNRLSEDLASARVGAESDKLRSALLNSVSHDLRTPLVGVIGATSTLIENDDAIAPPDRRQLLLHAHDEALRLNRYIQNLLDMTRLGHGALKLKRSAVDLREIIGSVRTDLARALDGHEISVNIPRNMPPLDVDPVLIGQALANLIDNAAKYAPAGTAIAITAERRAGFALIAISDQGSGVPVTDRDRVFDLFYTAARGDGAPAGTGMGLSIVKGFVEAHGGTVEMTAGKGGVGSTVLVKLPLSTEVEKADPT